MFLGLRLIEGVSKTEFEKNFGRHMDEIYGEKIIKLVKLGLLTDEGANLRLTAKGLDLANQVMSEFV